jgi:DNA processing protein
MEYKILTPEEYPSQLREIPHIPKQLYIEGILPEENTIYLSVVGSRRHTNYGKDVCQKLIEGLKGYPIVIVSGLALGIDTLAHETALSVGLTTIAFPGSGIDRKVLYPASNRRLADKIIESGGALISEFAPNFKATIWSFPQRNRIMAGISKAVLIIEAEEKSGTLITARLATDYNRDVLAVPGQIFSDASIGTNTLIRQGATPIRSSIDILEALGFDITAQVAEIKKESYENLSSEERQVLEILRDPCERDMLILKLQIPVPQANALLSIMEIKGLIKEELGELRLN